MPKPTVRLLVPHSASVSRYNAPGYAVLPPSDAERPARARTDTVRLGTIAVCGEAAPFYGVGILPETINLPDPQEGVWNIVSKMTALAAGPEREDLLFLYGDQRNESGGFIGVKGLGRPCFQQRELTEGIVFQGVYHQIENTAPHPMKLYAPDTPKLVPPDHKPLICHPVTREYGTATQLSYDDGGMLDHELGAEIGMNVFTTPLVQGVENDTSKPGDGVLRLANPNVLLTLGVAGMEAGYVTPIDEVRNGDRQSSYFNSILGGRALGVYLPLEHYI